MIYLIVLGRLLQYFPSLLILFLYTTLCEKNFGFQEKDLISIYRDYFIIITSLKKYFELIEIYSWRKELLVVTKA